MSIVSSRESTPLSKGDDEVSDSSLKELLEQEMDLHLQIEAVQEEIGKLEERLGLPNANDLEDEGINGVQMFFHHDSLDLDRLGRV
jgi:hypothetical protein